MFSSSLFWVMLFVLISLIAVFTVPKPRIVITLPFALLSGFVLSFGMMYLYVNVFHWWKFNYTGTFSVAGVPLLSSLSWTPAVIIYTHFLSRLKKKWQFYGYILGASVATAFSVQILVIMNYVEFIKWNIFYTFVMALVLFSGLNYYLSHITLLKREEGVF